MLTEPKEHEFPAVAARCFASAISFMLKEDQGIICQGEDEDGILRKYGVWYADGLIHLQPTNNSRLSIGAIFTMHAKDDGSAEVAATLCGGEVETL